MIENLKVSVIVPIYKVEKYLKKCIDSIIAQTHSNLEIILVDDGSPDNCGKICDEYSKIDSRIIVLHKKNGGLSDARNFGIKKATGDFISFIDSDDFVAKDYVEYLLKITIESKADMGIILPYKFKEGKEPIIKRRKEKIVIYNSYDALETMLYQKEFDNAAWGKIYSRNIIKNIMFPVGKLYEDIGTTYKYILNSKKIVYSNQFKYFYLQRGDSIMGSPFSSREMDYVYQTKVLVDDVEKINNSSLNKAAKCRYLNANFSVLLKIGKNNTFNEEKREIIENIKKIRKDVLFDKKSRIKTKIAIVLSYFGVV